jgi:hypothetical protein
MLNSFLFFFFCFFIFNINGVHADAVIYNIRNLIYKNANITFRYLYHNFTNRIRAVSTYYPYLR